MKNLLTLLCFIVLRSGIHAQTPLPYYTAFDNTAQRNGWMFYNNGVTQFSNWYYVMQAYSTPTCIAHNYPVGGSQTTKDWAVSPAFDFSAGGKIDSIRTNFGGFTSTLPVNDTIAIYLLQGASDPSMATAKTLLFDFRGPDYINDNTWRKFSNIVIPPTPGQSYLAIYYRTIVSWLDVKFDNLQLSANGSAPTASFSVPGQVCTHEPITFSDLSTNSPTASSWSFPGGSPATSGASNPTVTYAGAGTYTVTLVSSNNFGASAALSKTISIGACTGSSEYNSPLQNVAVYPNPGTGIFNIRVADMAPADFSLFNLMGEKIMSGCLEKNSTTALTMALQPKGIYFLRIESGKNSRTIKILKE